MATAEQLSSYAQNLPDIYQEILSAFPRIEPHRKAHYGLAYQTIWADMEQRKCGISLGQLMKACERLAEQNVVEIKHRMFVHPTDTGEQLIEALAGQQAQQAAEVPALPPLPN